MDQKKFEMVLILIIPEVLQLVSQHYSWSELDTSARFYQSELYAQLEQEDTKLWHLSPRMLMHLFCEEYETGTIHYPEEV